MTTFVPTFSAPQIVKLPFSIQLSLYLSDEICFSRIKFASYVVSVFYFSKGFTAGIRVPVPGY